MPIRYLMIVMGLVGLVAGPNAVAQEYDLVIRNGRVVDGTGNPAFRADVGIREGRIAAVGRIRGKGREEVEASGCIVSPGFVDVHTHAEDVLKLPLAENFVRMGVTTLVLGNCGSSVADVGRLFGRVEETQVSVNVATLIGHGTVRGRVMGGSFMRPPTDEELAEMKNEVAQAMEAGAVGMSTGLIYLPGTFAKTEELVALAEVVGRYDGVYASHMRNESDQIFDALNEVFAIARGGGVRAEISHMKLSGEANWGQTAAVLEAIERARGEGLDVTQDQYLYTASSTGISQLIPDEAREGGRFRDRIADPAQKEAIVARMKERLTKRGREDYAYAVIAHYGHDSSLDGLNLVEAAKRVRGSDSVDDQVEVIFEIQNNGGASAVFHGMSEEDLQSFLSHPNTMIAADSGVREFNKGRPHPRGYGNTARLLGRYVRELKVLRMEEAIRRVTSLPASVFRLPDRGLVRSGYRADLVVFDPNEVRDRATFEEPHQYATGFRAVLVNGRVVVSGDVHTGVRPGQPVRRAVVE